VDNFILKGRLNGNVTATKAVDLLKTGRLRGNITTPSLSVERGALFQGESKMDDRGEHKPPTTFQPPPEVPKTVQ